MNESYIHRLNVVTKLFLFLCIIVAVVVMVNVHVAKTMMKILSVNVRP